MFRIRVIAVVSLGMLAAGCGYDLDPRNRSKGDRDSEFQITATAPLHIDQTIFQPILDPMIWDPTFYDQRNPDVTAVLGEARWSTRDHWAEYGSREGRWASPRFLASEYFRLYPAL